MPKKTAYSWSCTYCCRCSRAGCLLCSGVSPLRASRCWTWKARSRDRSILRELLLSQLDREMFLPLRSILQVRNGEVLLITIIGPALPPPLLAAGRARSEAEGSGEPWWGFNQEKGAGAAWPHCVSMAAFVSRAMRSGCWYGMEEGQG